MTRHVAQSRDYAMMCFCAKTNLQSLSKSLIYKILISAGTREAKIQFAWYSAFSWAVNPKERWLKFPNENDEDDIKIHLQGETLRSTQIALEHHKVFPDSRDEDGDMVCWWVRLQLPCVWSECQRWILRQSFHSLQGCSPVASELVVAEPWHMGNGIYI